MGSLPIVAMTANAMDSHREECLLAGMNDFMTKPINPEALEVALLRWIDTSRIDLLTRSDVDTTTMAAQPASRTLEDIDGLATAEGLKRLLDNRSLYERLLRRFWTEHQQFNQKLAKLMLDDNAIEAKFLVHTLKGVAATLGAVKVQREAAKLDTLLRMAAPVAECDAARIRLATALSNLLAELAVVLQMDDADMTMQAVPHASAPDKSP